MSRSNRLTFRVPASSANLGPGFDTLALAYKLYCKLTFEVDESINDSGPLIEVKGRNAGELSIGRDNLLLQVIEQRFANLSKLMDNMRISIDSEIPIGRGLGSSAACIVGTIWAGLHFSEREPDRDLVYQLATQMEGHPDNVAASLYGGLVASGHNKQLRKFVVARLKWPADWCPVVVVPSREVSTARARTVLPRRVALQEAVHNIQNTALLISGIEKHDAELFSAGLSDCLHEPYRQELVPEMQNVKDVLRRAPVLGVVLSGAGSSILVFCEQDNVQNVVFQLKSWCSTQARPPEVLSLQVDEEGIRAGEGL